jgi:hypothetical protein
VGCQVLDISKHEITIRTTARSARAGQVARLYRFPSRAPVTLPPPKARKRPSQFRIHLAVEITIGLLFWLTWFVWHLMH